MRNEKGARLHLTITTRTNTDEAWYTVGETTVEAEETIWLDVLAANFSTLKRVVQGRCSCRPRRESIHVKPSKVQCKCTKEGQA